ncbi:hypothetical protein PENTCL1PPCAC_20671, partial [Pristionchus entomophagus]
YQIMLFLALADMGALVTTGTAFGYVAFNGMHFCSNVLLIGINGSGFWYTSTCACALLVINRICELTERGIWFQGWRSSLCMLLIVVYSFTNGLFSRPVLANSVHETIALDPFIPGHLPEEYPNMGNLVHNSCVAVIIPSLYLVLMIIVRKNSHQFKDSTAAQALQAK